MSDLAIGLDTTDFTVVGDFVLGELDIVTGDELKTAILVSLFTDRGWWANTYEADEWGSDLMTLRSAKHSNDTLLKAQDYCRAALTWLIEDGVASAVDVSTGWVGTTLGIGIVLTQGAGSTSYSFVWKGV